MSDSSVVKQHTPPSACLMLLIVYVLSLPIHIAPFRFLLRAHRILFSTCHLVNGKYQVDQSLQARSQDGMCLRVDCTIGSQFVRSGIF